MASRLRVFIACSLDGFIAGPDGDLSWLPTPEVDDNTDYGWGDFIGAVGCHLMGRGTYDAVMGMDVEWPYTERDTFVATNRPLVDPPARVTAATGGITDLVALAKERAGGKDVYIDGGDLVRQAMDAGLIDEMIVTVCPVVLGSGHPLFAGVHTRQLLDLRGHRSLGHGVVQLTYVPARRD